MVGDVARLPAFAPETHAPAWQEGLKAGSRSASVDRSHWQPLLVDVPVDGANYRTTFVRTRLSSESSARERGDFPTPSSALETRVADPKDQALEAFGSPFRAAWDAVRLPYWLVRAQYAKPAETTRGVRWSYLRSVAGDARAREWSGVSGPPGTRPGSPGLDNITVPPSPPPNLDGLNAPTRAQPPGEAKVIPLEGPRD